MFLNRFINYDDRESFRVEFPENGLPPSWRREKI